jgi:hypothetical protein
MKTIAKNEREKTNVFAILLRVFDKTPIKKINDKIIKNSRIVLLSKEREKSIIDTNNLTLGSIV